jgi:hypothetical protein
MHRACMTLAALALAAELHAGPVMAQSMAGPSKDQLAETVRTGTVAALAPVCGLRDSHWAADLRRAAIQAATQSHAHDDPGLQGAPGSALAIGALSFADAEALESFAEAPAQDTCGPLAHSPGLDHADELVRRFREQAPAS